MTTKKELKTRIVGNHVQLYYDGGGELPQELSGLYTSKTRALNAAEQYLSKRDSKNVKGDART